MNAIMLACVVWTVWCIVVGMAYGNSSWKIGEGTFTPTDMEKDECYFPIGTGINTAVLSFPPNSPGCELVRGHLLNRPGKLVFVPDDEVSQ